MAKPMSNDQMIAALKAAGLKVKEVSGWRDWERDDETGNAFGEVHGIMVHHTAGVFEGIVDFCRRGTAELPGPLCHVVIDKQGTVWLISNGRANHAGGGDPAVLAAVKAETHPLPKTTKHQGESGAVDGNDHFYGAECVNKGDGKDPWPAAQLTAMKKWAAAIARHHNWSARSVIRHMDWSDYKSDPKGIDWAKFQADVQKLLDAGAPKPPTTQPKPPAKPVGLPVVSLKNVVAASRRDPGLPQGGTTHRAEVDLVEEALVKLGYLDKRWADGSYGTYTVAAYARLQRHLGYSGDDADGTPGSHSLTWLGQKTQMFRKGN